MFRGQQVEDLDALMTDRTYLGDGAFCALAKDSGDLLIYAEDGIKVTNAVVLDASGAAALVRFIERHTR